MTKRMIPAFVFLFWGLPEASHAYPATAGLHPRRDTDRTTRQPSPRKSQNPFRQPAEALPQAGGCSAAHRKPPKVVYNYPFPLSLPFPFLCLGIIRTRLFAIVYVRIPSFADVIGVFLHRLSYVALSRSICAFKVGNTNLSLPRSCGASPVLL